MAGGYKRQIVRSDGADAMVSHVRLSILATMADGPYEVTQEQTSKSQSLGSGLAEGAVKEAKANIRTFRYELKRGLGREVPENHDTLAWLVQHAAATINCHRIGVDGRTPFHRRTHKNFRRVTPVGQTVVWMATGKDASRIGAESRWRGGIFLGLFGADQGANDCAVGTPDGVEAARAIKLEPAESAWDVELLLSVKELPWDRKRRDPTTRVNLPRTLLPVRVPLPAERRAG